MSAGWALMPVARAARTSAALVAAWQQQDEQRIGVLSVGERTWSVQDSLVVPTRAHGLWAEADGSVLAVARRPGDWLLRWHPASGRKQWHWIGGDRRFNGHVVASADRTTLWTSETDLDTALGRIGVRHAASLEKTAEWPTHGRDPHQLLALPQAVGDLPAGTLMVANGGIATLPETGRSKRELGRMDASLVALRPDKGTLLGQWRLGDPYLSIRHLAFDPISGMLGIALQAEHPQASAKATAPVLALWDGDTLRAAEGQPPMGGYGGDICALPAGGFAVSCPRAGQLALFDTRGRWQRGIEHPAAYALTAGAGQWWLASVRSTAGLMRGTDGASITAHIRNTSIMQIDNHWVVHAG